MCRSPTEFLFACRRNVSGSFNNIKVSDVIILIFSVVTNKMLVYFRKMLCSVSLSLTLSEWCSDDFLKEI